MAISRHAAHCKMRGNDWSFPGVQYVCRVRGNHECDTITDICGNHTPVAGEDKRHDSNSNNFELMYMPVYGKIVIKSLTSYRTDNTGFAFVEKQFGDVIDTNTCQSIWGYNNVMHCYI